MATTDTANFSSFASRLSPVAFACFKAIAAYTRETIERDGPQQVLTIPVNDLLAKSEADDVASLAESIRQIIDCRVEVKRGEYLYFFPFFSAIRIEAGMLTFSLPEELITVLPESILP
jgi:hypothetical protein